MGVLCSVLVQILTYSGWPDVYYSPATSASHVGTAGVSHDAQLLKYSINSMEHRKGKGHTPPMPLSVRSQMQRVTVCLLSVCPLEKVRLHFLLRFFLTHLPTPPPKKVERRGKKSKVGQLGLGTSSATLVSATCGSFF